MKIKRLHFTIDSTNKAQAAKKSLFKNYKNYNPKKSDVIVVVGGDGFMLATLKKYQRYNKPFYGMNRGSFGFLMNKYKTKKVLKKITEAKPVIISPLEMKTINKTNKVKSAIAINEISLLRQSRQTAALRIICGKSFLIKRLICDGVLVSTPAGSTAYNLSVNGPILSLNSKKIAITPISPFRPRRWKGKVTQFSSLIKIKNLNTKKRPVSVVADNIEVRNIKKVNIKVNNKIKFKLLYDKANSLSKKIKLESLKKIKND
jgi:NAD+ kinase